MLDQVLRATCCQTPSETESKGSEGTHVTYVLIKAWGHRLGQTMVAQVS